MMQATDLEASEVKLGRVGEAIMSAAGEPYSMETRNGVYLIQDVRDVQADSFGTLVHKGTDFTAAHRELRRLLGLHLAKTALRAIMDEGLL